VFAGFSRSAGGDVAACRQHRHVDGFLADGINDPGALKTVDVGISVGTAADIHHHGRKFELRQHVQRRRREPDAAVPGDGDPGAVSADLRIRRRTNPAPFQTGWFLESLLTRTRISTSSAPPSFRSSKVAPPAANRHRDHHLHVWLYAAVHLAIGASFGFVPAATLLARRDRHHRSLQGADPRVKKWFVHGFAM
jgi:hypothetical protein